MSEVVYTLCALTSLLCSALLLRGYLRTRARLLLWSSICFAGLAAQNVLLFVDLVLFPHVDLSLLRNLVGLAGLCFLIYGLVWDLE